MFRNIFRNRAVLVALGLLLLALIIWFAGHYFAFGTLKPFESAVERLVAILILVTLYAFYVLFRRSERATQPTPGGGSFQAGRGRAGRRRESRRFRGGRATFEALR